METTIRRAGAAMAAGGLLMFTRMAPIFTILPDDMAFPPQTTLEMVRLATIAGARWQWSHLMGLVAVLLFAVAHIGHAIVMVQTGRKRTGYGIAVTSIAAFGLFAIALVIDGFVLPAIIEQYVSAKGGASASLAQVAASHQLALRFFTPAVLLMFASVAVLSVPMLHRQIHARWLGLLGQIIAVGAATAYLTGMAGPHWNELQVAGTLMMAAFAWHLLVGSRALLVNARHPAAAVTQRIT